MGRNRSRSRSRSPRRRKRYDDPRETRSRRRERTSPPPSGLLVRNLPLDARPEELRFKFEKFGPIRDVYLPKHYYTGEPRGFGFVKYRNPEDAAEAKDYLNNTVIGGREIRIVFAEENRRAPKEMRRDTRVSDRGSYRRRSPVRSPRRRYRSSSRCPSPTRSDPRGPKAGDDRYSPHRSRSVSRSPSPRDERDHQSDRKSLRRSKSTSRSSSPVEKKSHEESSRSPRDTKKLKIGHKSRNPSGDGQASGARYNEPSRSPSPRGKAHSLSKSHRSASPGGNGQRSGDERSPVARRKVHSPLRSPSPRGNGRRSREKRYGDPDNLPSLRGKVRSPATSRSPSYSPHRRVT